MKHEPAVKRLGTAATKKFGTSSPPSVSAKPPMRPPAKDQFKESAGATRVKGG